MKEVFSIGDQIDYRYEVKPDDVAAFQGKTVHPVCSTFTLAREIEWTTRQFVLQMRDDDEEGVGTFLSIDHKSPAFVGDIILFRANVDSLRDHELICSYQAYVGDRLVAAGKTGQKILKKNKLERLFKSV